MKNYLDYVSETPLSVLNIKSIESLKIRFQFELKITKTMVYIIAKRNSSNSLHLHLY